MAASPPEVPCVSCRTPLPYGARFCNVCGSQQPAPGAAPVEPVQPRPKVGAQTVLGVASPLVGGAQPPAPQYAQPPAPQYPQPAAPQYAQPPAPQYAQPPAPQYAQPPAQPAQKVGAQTMVGGSWGGPPAPPSSSPPSSQPPSSKPMVAAAQYDQAPLPKKPFASTVLGVAVPAGVAQAAAQPAPQTRNVPKGTLVGVAVPGVAPTHDRPPAPAGWSPPAGPPPSQSPAPAPPQYDAPNVPPAYGGAPPQFVAPPQWQPQEDVQEHETPAPKKPSRLPVFLLLGLALIGIAVAAVLVLRPSGPPPLTSSIDEQGGTPKLVVQCDGCADGSSLDLGGKKADFEGGKAIVPLAMDDLKAGPNVFKGTVTPKGKKPHDVELEVSIPYLVHTSLAPLEKGDSSIAVVFELASDAKGVDVDGKKIAGSGEKSVAVAIPKAADDARTFDKTVKYTVHASSGDVDGSLKLSIPYAQLRVTLPSKRAIVIGDSVDIAGRTAPGATIMVGDTKLAVDDQGVFKGKAPLAADSTTVTVRAFSPKLAPREVQLTVAHAASEADAVKSLRAEAKTPFDQIAVAPDKHVGEVADAKIEVAQTGEEDGRTVAVGETKCAAAAQGATCPVVRLLLPPSAVVAKGDVVEALGVVTRAVPIDKGKSTAVEIDGSVLAKK